MTDDGWQAKAFPLCGSSHGSGAFAFIVSLGFCVFTLHTQLSALYLFRFLFFPVFLFYDLFDLLKLSLKHGNPD